MPISCSNVAINRNALLDDSAMCYLSSLFGDVFFEFDDNKKVKFAKVDIFMYLRYALERIQEVLRDQVPARSFGICAPSGSSCNNGYIICQGSGVAFRMRGRLSNDRHRRLHRMTNFDEDIVLFSAQCAKLFVSHAAIDLSTMVRKFAPEALQDRICRVSEHCDVPETKMEFVCLTIGWVAYPTVPKSVGQSVIPVE